MTNEQPAADTHLFRLRLQIDFRPQRLAEAIVEAQELLEQPVQKTEQLEFLKIYH